MSLEYLKYVVTGEGGTPSLVQRVNRKGELVLMVMVEDFALTSPTDCGLLQEAVNPVDEGRGDVEVVEFPDHLMVLDCLKCRTEVYEKESGIITGYFQVWQGWREYRRHTTASSVPLLAL